MSEIRIVERRTYQAPVKGARIRFSRCRALEDWAHHLVRARMVAQCECEGANYRGGSYYPGEACIWHARAANGDGSGVFSAEIRAGMKRRLAKMLAAGWRPA